MICNPELEGNLDILSYCMIAKMNPLSENLPQTAPVMPLWK